MNLFIYNIYDYNMDMGSSRKIKNRPAIEIELTYDDVELIPNLIEEESFTEHILTETYILFLMPLKITSIR